MSEHEFDPSVPMVPAAKARNIARSLKWVADSLAEAGSMPEAARLERSSQWWMTYAAALALTEKGEGA